MTQMNGNNILNALSEAMADAVEKAGAATVLVDGRRRFPASGIAYAPDLILTADHVLEREEEIKVMLPDGTRMDATLAGRDPGSDLALLRLVSAMASVGEPAPQEARIGQLVLALGRPTPDGIQASLGVVSAIGGPVRYGRGGLLERYIRTDAAPYPGFSGGPLIDSAGRVVGVNTSGLARGASLTIPVAQAWKTAEMLARHGSVRRGYLGVRSQPVEIPTSQQAALGRPQETGLLLVSIERGSPADQAGLMVGDILTGLAGTPIEDPDELLAQLSGEVVGRPVGVEILRGGQRLEITVTIGERR